MEDLTSLVKLISTHKLTNIDLITHTRSTPKNKYQELYQAIYNGKVQDDTGAMLLLYGRENKGAYQKLRSRFKDKLYNSLFFLNQNENHFSKYEPALFQIKKMVSLVHILYKKGMITEYYMLSKKTLRLAYAYEDTSSIIQLLTFLIRKHGNIRGDRNKVIDYKESLKHWLKIQQLEIEAVIIHADLTYNVNYSKKSLNDTFLTKIENKSNLLIQNKKLHSHELYYKVYQVLSYCHIYRKEYISALNICQTALSYFEQKEYESVFIQYQFRQDLYSCYMYLKQYSKSEKLILQNIPVPSYGASQWIFTYSHYYTLSSQAGSYQKMYDITAKVLQLKPLKKYVNRYQSWLIREAYVHFLVSIGQIDIKISTEKPLKPFRLKRFLNDVPLHTTDKKGGNIAVLILQMLILFQQADYNSAIDRVEALKQYGYRYLKDESTFRSNCFFKFLMKVVEHNFNVPAIRSQTIDLYKTLNDAPMNFSAENARAEIIPYPALWDMTLEMLEKNRV